MTTGEGSFSAAAAAGTQSAERAEFSPACGSSDLSHLADTPVGQMRAVVPPMSDEEREQAAYRAGCLIDFFRAERECYEALYAKTGCFSHKGAADRAGINERKAQELFSAIVQQGCA